MNSIFADNKLTIYLNGRIDSSNYQNLEEELQTIRQQNPNGNVVLDLQELEYTSSAGLRTLLKFQKKEKDVSVINVSPAVYEIFDMTGFTTIFKIKKAMRHFSVEGLEKIGQGGSAAVYRIDDDKIVKVFKPIWPMILIEKEQEISQKLFLAGVSTAVPYDVVKVGDEEVGVIYECLNATAVIDLLLKEPGNGIKYMEIMAKLIKDNADTVVDDFDNFKSMTSKSVHMLGQMDVFTKEEVTKYLKIYENVPDRNTFIHGDYQPGNVMIENDVPMMIDLAGASKGHPVFDLAGTCTYLETLPITMTRENYMKFADGLEPEAARKLWKVFLHAYFPDKDDAFLSKTNTQIRAIAFIRSLTAAARNELFKSEEGMAKAKEFLKETYDIAISPIEF